MSKTITVTVTLDVPNDFESFSALERYVKDAGRQWQRDLCSRLANEKGVEVSEVACPHCGSPETIRKGTRSRQLKTQLGKVEVAVPRHQCKACDRSFFH
jgi:transposase-like protein